MSTPKRLKDSRWLADRLGLSISTLERLRGQGSPDIPKAILIGTAIRYDALFVEYFLLQRADPNLPPFAEWAAANIGNFKF